MIKKGVIGVLFGVLVILLLYFFLPNSQSIEEHSHYDVPRGPALNPYDENGTLYPMAVPFEPSIEEHGDHRNVQFVRPSPLLPMHIPEPESPVTDGETCDSTEVANLTAPQIVSYVVNHSTDCLLFFWTYDANILTVYTDSHIQAALNETQQRIPLYDGTNDQSLYQLFFYIRTAFYHESYHSPAPNFSNATRIRMIDVYSNFTNNSYFNNASSNAEDTLYHWLNGIDAAGVSYAFVPTLNNIMRTFLNETNRWSRIMQQVNVYTIESFNIARGLYILHPNRTQMINGMVQEDVLGTLEDIALTDEMVPTVGYSLINNAITTLGYMISISQFNISAVAALTNVTELYPYLTEPYLWAIYMLDYYNGCVNYHGVSLCMEDITPDIMELALPNNYSFDNGTRIFITGLNYSDIQELYHAIKQVEAQFFRVIGNSTPVAGDNNSAITMFVYATRANYVTYQPFLFGLGTNNGGIYIEQWGKFFTYERTPSESSYTLEELFRHEFTHYLVGRYLVPGMWGEAPIYNNSRMVWFDEGIAEFLAGSTQKEDVKLRETLVELIQLDGGSRLTIHDIFDSASYTSFMFYRYAGMFFAYMYQYDLPQFFNFTTAVGSTNLTAFDAATLYLGNNSTYEHNYQTFLNDSIAQLPSLVNPSTNFPRALNTTSLSAIQDAFRNTTSGVNGTCSILHNSSNIRFQCTGQITGTPSNATNFTAAWRSFNAVLNHLINETVNRSYNNFQGMNCKMNMPVFVNFNSTAGYPSTNYSCEGPIGFNVAIPQCFDEIDNDGDLFIDYPNDPDCFDTSDDNETRLASTTPLLDITFPLGIVYAIQPTELNYTLDDDNPQSCWYTLNSGISNTTITCGVNVTGLSASVGMNIWKVYANDSEGNSNFTTSTFNYLPNALSVGACGVLNQSNVTYFLNKSLTPLTTGPCLNVTAPNIAFTCANYVVVNNSHDGAIIYSNQVNTTIFDCKNLTAGNGLLATGVQFSGAHNSSIINVTIHTARVAISIGTISNIFIANSTGTGGVDSGITGTPTNGRFINNIFRGYARGITHGGTNNTIINNTVSFCVDGMRASAGPNYYYNNTGISNTYGYVISGGSQIIDGAYLFNNSYGISTSSNVEINVSRTTIHNSLIDGLAATSTASSVRFNLQNVSVRNSTGYDLNLTSGIYNFSIFNNTAIGKYIFSAAGGKYIFAKNGKGIIAFLQVINGSGTNLSNDIVIENNLVRVNLTSNIGINRSANITFYNMPGTFVNPVIYRDGSPCPPTICQNFTSLNANTVTFNVTDFGQNYTVSSEMTTPNLNITFPENTTYTTAPSALNYTVNDTNLESCWYTTNEGVTNTTIICGVNVTGLVANVGSNIWKVYANDTDGNTNSSNVAFIVSTTATSPDSSRSGGSGGGSGPVKYLVNATALNTGYTNYMRVGDVYTFAVKNQSHTLTLYALRGAISTILITSTPIWLNLTQGETRLVDVTGDNAYDILVRAGPIVNQRREIFLQSYLKTDYSTSDVKADTLTSPTLPCVQIEGCPENSFNWIFLITLVAMIISAIALFMRYRQLKLQRLGAYRLNDSY